MQDEDLLDEEVVRTTQSDVSTEAGNVPSPVFSVARVFSMWIAGMIILYNFVASKRGLKTLEELVGWNGRIYIVTAVAVPLVILSTFFESIANRRKESLTWAHAFLLWTIPTCLLLFIVWWFWDILIDM